MYNCRHNSKSYDQASSESLCVYVCKEYKDVFKLKGRGIQDEDSHITNLLSLHVNILAIICKVWV